MALSGSVSTNARDGRYYTLYWSASQSIASNQSTISWEVHAEGRNGYWYAERTLYVVLAGQVLVNKTNRVERYNGRVANGSFTVGHAWDGTFGFTGSVQAAIEVSTVNCKGEASFALDQIPRQANLNTATSFNDLQNPTITFSNPGGFPIYVWLEQDTGGVRRCKRNSIANTGSYTWSLTEEEREELRKLCTGNTLSIWFGLGTNVNGTEYKSYLQRTFSITDGNPEIAASVKDVNGKTLALTGDENVLVRFQSVAKAEMTATGKKHATIKDMRISNGQQVIGSSSGQFMEVENEETVFSVTDSRGNATTERVKRELIPYVRLTCDLVMENPDANGNVNIRVKGNCFTGSFGVSENTVTVFYQWKEDGGSYCDWIPIGNVEAAQSAYNAQVEVTGLNYTKRYVFQAKVADLLDEKSSIEKVVKTTPVFDWGEDDFNFNCIVNVFGKNIFDIIYPIGSIYMSLNATNPGELFGVGTWVQIKDRFLVSAGDEFEAESTGGKSVYPLRANIGAVDANPGTLGYITTGVTGLQQARKATYIISGGVTQNSTYWNHSTPVTDRDASGEVYDTTILPPYMAVYIWKRTE